MWVVAAGLAITLCVGVVACLLLTKLVLGSLFKWMARGIR